MDGPKGVPDHLPPSSIQDLQQPRPVPIDSNGHLLFPEPPAPIVIKEETKYSTKADPPLIDVKVTNPVTYLKAWLSRLLKNEGIDLRLKIKPLTAVAFLTAFATVSGTSFSIGRYLFPNSSPLLHRSVVFQGNIQQTPKGMVLILPNSDTYTLKLKNSYSLSNLAEGPAIIKGNLGNQKFVIDVLEVFPAPSNTAAQKAPDPSPLPEELVNADITLPKLFTNISWEATQRKTLVFTSGKRRINIDGVYLESSELKSFPQEFIDYYTRNLTNEGFKQTLESTSPDGKTFSFEKDGLFLSFGVKNIFKGTGDKKQLSSYKAYIEHN